LCRRHRDRGAKICQTQSQPSARMGESRSHRVFVGSVAAGATEVGGGGPTRADHGFLFRFRSLRSAYRRHSTYRMTCSLGRGRIVISSDQFRQRPPAPSPKGRLVVQAVRERRNDGSRPPRSSPPEGRARSTPPPNSRDWRFSSGSSSEP